MGPVARAGPLKSGTLDGPGPFDMPGSFVKLGTFDRPRPFVWEVGSIHSSSYRSLGNGSSRRRRIYKDGGHHQICRRRLGERKSIVIDVFHGSIVPNM